MADWRADVIRAVGGNPTAKTLAFLYGWQRKEGGATNNAASFNWLNRTDQGFPTINQVGVAAYPDYRTGISRTAELLQRGYPALTGALRSGAISYQDPNVQGDLNRWLTGKRTPGMSPYVSQVAQLSGAKGAAASVVGNPTAAPAPAVGARQPQSRMQPTLANILPLVAALRSRREGRQRGEPGSLAPVFGALMGLRTATPEAASRPSPTSRSTRRVARAPRAARRAVASCSCRPRSRARTSRTASAGVPRPPRTSWALPARESARPPTAPSSTSTRPARREV